ncbi:metal-binding protein [Oscillatoria sp. CS-180]|uniref:metal-binding protein n=1 Tax=Oscillatoria sp. CS-180 TaxID=3021720 RepID=UPI00232E52D0|nr:metal-binding protein [Oscillatoria sp. CS-180]MDB9527212.1 metal-binding protein [Oscillatoria sp. CS-180]
MPSGKTHDRITWWCTPWVGLGTMIATRHWGYTLLVLWGFIFAGLMFGPDLDIWSVQSKRWGWLAWIWRPYRKSLRHRSWLSHGFLSGTVVRLLYLSVLGFLGLLIVLEISNGSGRTSVTWNDLGRSAAQLFLRYWREWAAIAIGIELGAMSHSVSDWLVSAWQREGRRQQKGRHRNSRKK